MVKIDMVKHQLSNLLTYPRRKALETVEVVNLVSPHRRLLTTTTDGKTPGTHGFRCGSSQYRN